MCHYGFTLAIAPFRKVSYNGKIDKIRDFSEYEQDLLVTEIIEQYKPEGRVCEYEIEYTKAGVAHVHGFLNCSETEVYLMQESIHNAYGYKNQSPERVFMVKRTLQNLKYWKKYMRKTKK